MTFFEALTGAMGDAMALYGGARQTRIAQQSVIGDTVLHVERGSGLPEPGLVSVGRLTYLYDRAQPNQLTNIRALVGGTVVAGVLAAHPVGAGVVDVSGAWSELDGLRSALFVETATGEDLANLGRSLGVPRNEALANDDQYREIIKALAYARRGTTNALTALLNALLGQGNYQLSEDPFGQPGKVIISVPPTALVSKSALGKSYTSDIAPTQPVSGSFSSPAPAFGHGALVMAPLSVQQATTTLRPSEATPAALWSWSGPSEKDDVKFLADTSAPTTVATLATLNGAYLADAPQLPESREAELALVIKFVRPSAFGAAGTVAARLVCAGYGVTWIAQNANGAAQVALATLTYSRLSPWVTVGSGYSAIALRLNGNGAQLAVDGQVVGAVRLSYLTQVSRGTAAFGNLSGQAQGQSGASAPQMAVRCVSLSATPARDRWQGEGRNAVAQAPNRINVSGAAFAARHVGHRLIIRGGTASQGRNNGTWRIAQIISSSVVQVQGEPMSDGQLDAAQSSLTFTATESAFTYPDDLGKSLVVTTGSGTTTYTVQAVIEDSTGRDFATYQTVLLRGRAARVRLSGTANSAAVIAWRLDPVMVSEGDLSYVLSDPGIVKVGADGQTLTTYQPIPSQSATYVLPRRHVLGNIVRAKTSAYNKPLTVGPPVRLLVNPLYAHAPLDALETYLPSAAASGVDVILRT